MTTGIARSGTPRVAGPKLASMTNDRSDHGCVSPARGSVGLLRRLWAAAFACLLAISWRLWVPQWLATSPAPLGVDFPAVPLLALSPQGISLVEPLALLFTAGSLLWIAVSGSACWRPIALVLACLTLLLVANQHRLQPWAYQGWLYALVLTVFGNTLAARRWLTALAISVYGYSALGKFDVQFVRSVGADLLGTIMPWLDLAPGRPLSGALVAAVLVLPALELVIAALLAWPGSRRLGGWAAMLMHSLLIILLGPLGLDHSGAVLAWNVYLAIQAWVLFARPDQGDTAAAADLSPQLPAAIAAVVRPLASAILLAALLLPLGERLPRGAPYGYWDHWLSWSLYSPHTSRVQLQVHTAALESLPAAARRQTAASDDSDLWHDVRIDDWSLAELSVPIYPQARFQLGVARALGRQLDDPRAIRAILRSASDRRSGRRTEIWLLGLNDLQRQANQHWFLP